VARAIRVTGVAGSHEDTPAARRRQRVSRASRNDRSNRARGGAGRRRRKKIKNKARIQHGSRILS